ncbi:MAG: hypothetical protein LBG23_01100 [Endomicrobium sp.]|jgi:hypothetical protein|nr:hypothetical protein [Endomicrobium sp.]
MLHIGNFDFARNDISAMPAYTASAPYRNAIFNFEREPLRAIKVLAFS